MHRVEIYIVWVLIFYFSFCAPYNLGFFLKARSVESARLRLPCFYCLILEASITFMNYTFWVSDVMYHFFFLTKM